MAMSAPDYKDATHHLKAAEHALDEGHMISKSDREEERALVLAVAARRAAQNKSFEAAAKSVAQLETMAGQSRSQVIQLAYHSARGRGPVRAGQVRRGDRASCRKIPRIRSRC